MNQTVGLVGDALHDIDIQYEIQFIAKWLAQIAQLVQLRRHDFPAPQQLVVQYHLGAIAGDDIAVDRVFADDFRPRTRPSSRGDQKTMARFRPADDRVAVGRRHFPQLPRAVI